MSDPTATTTTTRRRPRRQPDAESTALAPAAPGTTIVVQSAPAPAAAPHEPAAPAHDASVLTGDAFIGLDGLGAAAFTKREAAALMAPATDGELDVLPTGELYAPQVYVRRRLNAAFGPGGWGLRPLANPRAERNTLTMPWGLICRGRFVAMAWGEADYFASNPRMSWATTIESVKSNALTRLCKDIGVFSEAWDRKFADAWRARCCVKVYRTNTPKDNDRESERWQWRRKDAPPFWDERRSANAPAPAPDAPTWDDAYAGQDVPRATNGAQQPTTQGVALRLITEPQRARLFELAKSHGVAAEKLHGHIVGLGIAPSKPGEPLTSRDIPQRYYAAICAWVQRGGR